jgi:catechol 2,3-dioxygenase-like lactoylglutathione lyase family enzyme
MEQRISLITLGVADLARSIAFYEKLGWQRSVRDAPGVAFFQTGGMAFGLWPREELVKDAGIADGGPGFAGICLAYNTRSREEVDSILAEAVAAGATLVKPGTEAFWGGYVGYFSDPDGYLWEATWNPGFPLDEDGALHLPG